MKHLLVTLGLLLACSAAQAQFSDSLSVTTGTVASARSTGPAGETITIDWTSSNAGNAVMPGLLVDGEIRRVVFTNSLTLEPTTLYDVTLTDADGVDVLTGDGANVANTTSTAARVTMPVTGDAVTSAPVVTAGRHTFSVSNAGDSKTGKVRIYLFRGAK